MTASLLSKIVLKSFALVKTVDVLSIITVYYNAMIQRFEFFFYLCPQLFQFFKIARFSEVRGTGKIIQKQKKDQNLKWIKILFNHCRFIGSFSAKTIQRNWSIDLKLWFLFFCSNFSAIFLTSLLNKTWCEWCVFQSFLMPNQSCWRYLNMHSESRVI